MNQLIKAIEKTNIENFNEVNKLLRNIHTDLLYFHRSGNLRELHCIADLLAYHASINTKEPYQGWVERRYYKGLGSLVQLCKELHG